MTQLPEITSAEKAFISICWMIMSGVIGGFVLGVGGWEDIDDEEPSGRASKEAVSVVA